jgi:hypothetical protein
MYIDNTKFEEFRRIYEIIRSPLKISVYLLSLALLCLFLCSFGDAADFTSSQTYEFSTTCNENYIYQWDASDGDFQENDKCTFTWTAPNTNTLKDITISLSVTDKTCSCRSSNSIIIKVIPYVETKQQTEVSLNNTTPINQNNSSTLEDKTIESQDPQQIAENNSEDAVNGILIANATLADQASIDKNESEFIANETIESVSDANQDVKELPDQKTITENSPNNDDFQSDAAGNTIEEIANYINSKLFASGIVEEEGMTDHMEQNKNRTLTIPMDDDTNVDIVFERSNPMMDTTYVAMNETNTDSNEGGLNQISSNDAASSSTTAEKSLEKNQTDAIAGNTSAEIILLLNESDESELKPMAEENSNNAGLLRSIASESEPNDIIEQANAANDQASISDKQSAAVEDLPDYIPNNYESSTLENPLEPAMNQT